MSDTTALHDLPFRRALNKIPDSVRTAWQAGYLTQEGGEHQAQALVERAGRDLEGPCSNHDAVRGDEFVVAALLIMRGNQTNVTKSVPTSRNVYGKQVL